MQTILNLLAAVGLVLLLGLGWMLDPLEDHGFEHAQAADLEAAQREARAQFQREAAARALCERVGGPNTAAVWRVDGSIACKTKRGHTIATVAAGQL